MYAEFLMTSQESSQETYFYLEAAVRSFYKLNEQNLKGLINYGNRHEAHIGSKGNLTIVEGEFFNEFSHSMPSTINKNTFVLIKNKKVLGLFEINTRHEGDRVFYSFNIFIKEMSDEHLRLMLEFTLPKKLGSQVIAIRDKVIECVSLKSTPDFKKSPFYFSIGD